MHLSHFFCSSIGIETYKIHIVCSHLEQFATCSSFVSFTQLHIVSHSNSTMLLRIFAIISCLFCLSNGGDIVPSNHTLVLTHVVRYSSIFYIYLGYLNLIESRNYFTTINFHLIFFKRYLEMVIEIPLKNPYIQPIHGKTHLIGQKVRTFFIIWMFLMMLFNDTFDLFRKRAWSEHEIGHTTSLWIGTIFTWKIPNTSRW